MTFKLRDEALHWRQIEDEVVAVDMKTAAYLGANPAGALLWEALVDGATKAQLAALLVERFSIDESRAAADVDAFLAQLDEAGLLAA
jgi:coenzyme PQQ synthesis protein D (PqqD)